MLKDLVKARERGGSLVPMLHESALLAGKRDSMQRRRDVFHPSEICGDFCPRAWLLGVEDPSLYGEREIGAQLQWVFDVGSSVHELVQERLAATGNLFGQWQCKRWCLEKRCRTVGFKPDDDAMCQRGFKGRAKFVYQEVPVVDTRLNIAGKTDGIMRLKMRKRVVEFKTMNSRTFSTLAEPLESHKEQSLWYVDILQRENDKLVDALEALVNAGANLQEELDFARLPYDGSVLLYMNKDTQEFKEFMVDAHAPMKLPASVTIRGMDLEEDHDWMAEKRALLSQTLVWRDEKFLPARLELCTSKSCTRAKNCFAKRVCFERE